MRLVDDVTGEELVLKNPIGDSMNTGTELITIERQRQISKEGWTPNHDDEHTDGSLAMVAACYAAPRKLYIAGELAGGFTFFDPWPESWHRKYDKRLRYGERNANPANMVPDPPTYSKQERIDLLTKSGALIAAELDRLLRAV